MYSNILPNIFIPVTPHDNDDILELSVFYSMLILVQPCRRRSLFDLLAPAPDQFFPNIQDPRHFNNTLASLGRHHHGFRLNPSVFPSLSSFCCHRSPRYGILQP
jgi:hypothetical protein